jgi:pentatricopeptide repeat protein
VLHWIRQVAVPTLRPPFLADAIEQLRKQIAQLEAGGDPAKINTQLPKMRMPAFYRLSCLACLVTRCHCCCAVKDFREAREVTREYKECKIRLDTATASLKSLEVCRQRCSFEPLILPRSSSLRYCAGGIDRVSSRV